MAKTSEKCKTVDMETASFLAKSNKLQEVQKEQFDRHQVLIDHELTDPCNIWIVCEELKMKEAENELACLTDEKRIVSGIFKPTDQKEVRFIKEHHWCKIKEKGKNCKAEGVEGTDVYSDSLEIKGTWTGRGRIQQRIFTKTSMSPHMTCHNCVATITCRIQ